MPTSSSSAYMVAIAAAFVGGCNSIFGLEPPSTDEDRDGVADAEDNCPSDANPQQADRDDNGLGDVCDCALSGIDADDDDVDDACDDCVGAPLGRDVGGNGVDDGCEVCPEATGTDVDGDGLEDACDPCLLGDAHDEDADGVADACDNCPSRANPDQRNADGDAIGDACAAGTASLVGSRFDSMAAQDETFWLGNVAGWRWDRDGLVTDAVAQRFSSLRLASSNFLVETTAVTTVDSGIELVDTSGLVLLWRCTVDSTRRARLYEDVIVASQDLGVEAPGEGPVRLRLSSHLTPTGNVTWCDVLDDAGVVVSRAQLDTIPRGRLGLRTDGPSRFEYLWVVTD